MSTPTPIEVYWRPGCGFCMHLERSLSETDIPVTWHNIWDDPDAAAFVRSVANGNEVVPTVTIDNQTFVNPDPRQLITMATTPSQG